MDQIFNLEAFFFDNMNKIWLICGQRTDFDLSDTTLSSLTPSLVGKRILPKEDLDVVFSGLPGSSVAPAQIIHIAQNSNDFQTFICSSAKSVKMFSGKGCASKSGFADVPMPRRFGEESLLFNAFIRSSSLTCSNQCVVFVICHCFILECEHFMLAWEVLCHC